MTTLHEMLDVAYGPRGATLLRGMLAEDADPESRSGALEETALHVASRRRRLDAVEILIAHGVDLDARNAGGKTAYVHAIRRGFDEIADALASAGADTTLDAADRFAVAVTRRDLDLARSILETEPGVARTGNVEEDRLLADMAGRHDPEGVKLLIDAGADLAAPGLDGGTPLHQAAWFGQPECARLLIAAGAPLDVFDPTHEGSPIAWATHGSSYSGGADERQEVYVELVRMLLEAECRLHYPDQPDDDAYLRRLHEEATPAVRALLPPLEGATA